MRLSNGRHAGFSASRSRFAKSICTLSASSSNAAPVSSQMRYFSAPAAIDADPIFLLADLQIGKIRSKGGQHLVFLSFQYSG